MSASPTRGRASRPPTAAACSTRSSRPGPTEPDWVCFPAAASSRRMAARSGFAAGPAAAPSSRSGCRASLLPLYCRRHVTIAGKILVVEDDRAIAQSLMRLLSRDGYFIHAVPSGEEAAAHLREDPSYDLALLDVALPGMDGFACCRALREQGWRQPILMLTGRGGGHGQDRRADVGRGRLHHEAVRSRRTAGAYRGAPAPDTRVRRSRGRRARDHHSGRT